MSDFYKSAEQLLDSIEDEEWRRIKETGSYNEIANLFVKEDLAILIIKVTSYSNVCRNLLNCWKLI